MAKNCSAAGSGTKYPPRRAIRAKQVLEIYPVSEAQLYKEIAAGLFPSGFALTPGGKCRAWWSDEVEAIVEARAAASKEVA